MSEQFSGLVASHRFFNVGQFISEQSETVQEIVLILDELFLSYPNVGSKIRYHIPFYDYNTWVCYINPLKKGEGVELVFLKGKELSEVFPFLEVNGRKLVAGITIKEITEDILEQVIMVWEEALSTYN